MPNLLESKLFKKKPKEALVAMRLKRQPRILQGGRVHQQGRELSFGRHVYASGLPDGGLRLMCQKSLDHRVTHEPRTKKYEQKMF